MSDSYNADAYAEIQGTYVDGDDRRSMWFHCDVCVLVHVDVGLNVLPLIMIYVIQKLVGWIELHRYKFEPRRNYTRTNTNANSNVNSAAAHTRAHDAASGARTANYHSDFPVIDYKFYQENEYEFDDDYYESFTD